MVIRCWVFMGPQELSELAQGINFMLHRLDAGAQQLSQYSDDLAHELRTPINNLMGKAQVTLSCERTTEQYKDGLVSCTEELERVARIVSDMLFLAQVSHPSALALFEPVALEVEVAKVAEMCSLHERPHRLQASSHSDPGCTRNLQGYFHRPDKMETPLLWREKALSTSFT